MELLKEGNNDMNHHKLTVQVLINFTPWHGVLWWDVHCRLDSGCRQICDKFRSCETTKKNHRLPRISKVEIWKALVSLLKSSSQVTSSYDDNTAFSTHIPILVEKVNLIGKLVADNLLQCDLKDWSRHMQTLALQLQTSARFWVSKLHKYLSQQLDF